MSPYSSRTGVKRKRAGGGGGVQRPTTRSGDAPFLTSEWITFDIRILLGGQTLVYSSQYLGEIKLGLLVV